jgi:hypothetical protein
MDTTPDYRYGQIRIAYAANAHIRATAAVARRGDNAANPRRDYCRELAEACEAAVKADQYHEISRPHYAGIC